MWITVFDILEALRVRDYLCETTGKAYRVFKGFGDEYCIEEVTSGN